MRRSEWILVAYFCYTAVLSFFLPVSTGVRTLTCILNLSVIASFALAAYADSFRRGPLLRTIRDWYPLPLTLLCYREMGWFAPAHHSYLLERQWIVWDRLILHDLHARAAIESLGPFIPALLEVAYALVYAIPPFALAMLYVYGRRDYLDRFWTVFLFGLLLSYLQFPFWPSEPPRVVFPGEDFPSFDTAVRKFNQFLVGGYGIHTSVFPSAHVSGAFAAAFGMWRLLPERRWTAWTLLVLAVLIALATVYGRYHYAADAVTGFAIGTIAFGIWRLWERRIDR